MSVLITVAIVLVVLFVAGFVYDRLARLKKAVQATWRQLERHRQARHAIVERLAAAFPPENVDSTAVAAVLAARRSAASVAGPTDAARKEAALSEALGALLTASAIAMNAQVAALARELGEAERAYRDGRGLYNNTARRYNTAISVIPGSLIAKVGSFPQAELFE